MRIAGIGTAFPAQHIEQARASELVTQMLPLNTEEARSVKAIYRSP